MGLFYEETDDTPKKIGSVIGSIIAIGIFIAVVVLMIFPLWH